MNVDGPVMYIASYGHWPVRSLCLWMVRTGGGIEFWVRGDVRDRFVNLPNPSQPRVTAQKSRPTSARTHLGWNQSRRSTSKAGARRKQKAPNVVGRRPRPAHPPTTPPARPPHPVRSLALTTRSIRLHRVIQKSGYVPVLRRELLGYSLFTRYRTYVTLSLHCADSSHSPPLPLPFE